MKMNLFPKNVFLLGLCLLACGDNEEKPFDKSNVEFRTLTINSTQELIAGKWEIFEVCGGVVGCIPVNNVSYVFEKKNVRIYDEKEEKEIKIADWEKSDSGWSLISAKTGEQVILLDKIVNDTLYFNYVSETDYIIFTYAAIR